MLLACGQPKTSTEAFKDVLEQIKTTLANAQTNLQKAQERMRWAVDKRRRSETYMVSDEVVLTTENFRSYCLYLPPKIKARWVCPFCIT